MADCVRFHANIGSLCEYVYDIVLNMNNRGIHIVPLDHIRIASLVIQGFDKVTLIEGFIERSYMHWDSIHTKNKKFFCEEADKIFHEIPSCAITAFRDIFNSEGTEEIVTQEVIETLWDYFEALVKICIKYVHNKKRTTRNYQPGINAGNEAKKWGVALSP